MKRVNLVDFSDLLFYAQEIGYGWNEAHDILVKDRAYPEAEANTKDVSMWDIEHNENSFEWSDDTLKIIGGFMTKNKVKEITIVND